MSAISGALALGLLVVQPVAPDSIAQASSAAETPTSGAETSQPALVLAAGTAVPLETTESLNSKTAQQGQRLSMRTSEEVRVGSYLVIPKGSRAVGEVTRVLEKGLLARSGKLDVEPLFVEVGAARVRLTGRLHRKGAPGTAPAIASALLIGVGGGFITGKSAELPPGSQLVGYVNDDIPLEAPKP